MIIPIFITIIRIILAPIIYWNIINGNIAISIILAIVAALSDFFDGYFARMLNQESNFGKVLDPIADKIFIGFTLVGLYVGNLIPLFILVLFLLKDIIMLIVGSYLLYYLQEKLVKISYISKITTTLQCVMLLLFLVQWKYVYFIYWPVIVLSLYTAIDYGINRKNYMVKK